MMVEVMQLSFSTMFILAREKRCRTAHHSITLSGRERVPFEIKMI
jgi:hypothetical protein